MKRFMLFIGKCLAICGTALLVLFLLDLRYRQVMDNPYSDADKFHYMDSDYSHIQICNIGSSHGEYAFNYEDLEDGYQCFNFAMSSQTYDYDYAVLSMYRDHFAEECLMFIPVSYFSFNNEVVDEAEADFLHTKYYSFLSPKYIPDYDPYVDLVTHRLPILSAGEDMVKLFPRLSLKAFASEAGQKENGGDSDARFRQMAWNRYNRHMRRKREYFLQERIGNLSDILDFCREEGITPVLITTPFTGYYYKQAPGEFKEEFRSVIASIAGEYGVPYYDYSEDERFGEHLEYFSDADHLNKDGSLVFMEILRQEIPEFADFLSNNEPQG